MSFLIGVEHLRAQRALAHLDDGTLAELARRGRYTTVAAGELLAGDGLSAPHPRLIDDGVAWVLRHGRRVARLGPGDLLDDRHTERKHRSASIVAATPMRLIQLPGLNAAPTETAPGSGRERPAEQAATPERTARR